MIIEKNCLIHGKLNNEEIQIVKRKDRKSDYLTCKKCNVIKQKKIREKQKIKFKDFHGICKVDGCNSVVKYPTYMLCGIHRYRWEKYKSYEAPKQKSLPENIKMKCKIHGFLTIDEVDISEHFYKCKQCRKERRKKNKEDPRKVKNSYLKRIFKITLEDYEKLLEKQNNLCKICNKPETMKQTRSVNKLRSLAVDHCHETGKIRGLLCGRCNNMIGYAKDNPNILRLGADYLER